MRKGERYRKGVRGCIISRHISVLHLVIVKKGPAEIPGLTDESIPCAITTIYFGGRARDEGSEGLL